MEIIPVNTSKLFDKFLDFSNEIYQNCPNYVAPLRLSLRQLFDKKNPLWEDGQFALFLAVNRNKVLGRIAAFYFKKHEQIHGKKCGYFGFFDAINDSAIAQQLLNRAKQFSLSFECESILGPLNPNTNYELGVLVKGFENPPYFMMPYNYDYYSTLLQNLGGKVAMNFKAYSQPCEIASPKIHRVAEKIKERYSIRIENIDFNKFNSEALQLAEVYNDAFKNHWAFLPFSKSEFLHVAKDMKQVMDKQLIFKIYVGDELAGFIMALPNLNETLIHLKNGRLTPWNLVKFFYYKQKIKWAKVMVVAVLEKFQHLGLGSILYLEMGKRGKMNGYMGAELSWVAGDNNAMNKVIQSMDAKVTKEYQVFEFSSVI